MATKKTKPKVDPVEKERRDAHLARQHDITEDDLLMLDTVKRYSWYIDNAFRTKTEELGKAIMNGRKSMEHDDGADVYRSMEGMLEHCEYVHKEYMKAWQALKEAGVK